MPFPSLSMSKPNADTRPLLYAQSQSPSTPSLAPSSTSTSTNANAHAANDTNPNPPNPKADNNNNDDDDTEQNSNDALPPVARPKTPPQSSNHLPWSSYHDLPPDHPVFRYPDAVREKMYAKGVGTLFAPLQPIASIIVQQRMCLFFPDKLGFPDPVVKAEMDLARLGRVYGEHHHRKGFWKRGTSMMGQFGNIARGGSF